MKFVGKEELLNHINRPEVRHIRNISPKSLSKKQRNRLLREVEKSQNLRNIAIVYTMLYTGVRVFELVGLNRDDVEMKEQSGFIIIRDGKGGISRKIPLPAESRYHLQNYLQNEQTWKFHCFSLILENDYLNDQPKEYLNNTALAHTCSDIHMDVNLWLLVSILQQLLI